MREGLRRLTLRGRAFLAAGITAVVCAIVLDQPQLSRIGVLLVVLALATAYVVGRGRYRLALVRTVTPHVVTAGQPARVELVITNEGWIPTGSLLLEEALPYALGSRPRFVVDRLGPGWRRQVDYQVRSDVRGRYDVGPMSVRVTDAFGLVELGRAFQTTAQLVVTPRTVELSPIALGGARSAAGDSRPRAFAIGSAEDVTVREYRRGDDLRRVHWRSSARVGELMVRREEQPWQARATVFLDNRALAHRGAGAGSSFEAAVVAAASVLVHLAQRGYTVRLVTASGEVTGGRWHDRTAGADATEMLQALADVQLVPTPTVDAGWAGEASAGGLTVAIVGSVDDADLSVLRRVRHQAGSALGIALDVGAWAGGVPGHAGMPALVQHGWRAAVLHPQDRLDEVWRQLGRRRAANAATSGSTDPAEVI